MSRTKGALGFVLIMMLALSPSAGWAQGTSPIASDRPGFGDVAAVMSPTRFQVEAGYTFQKVGSVQRHAIGQVLLRYGLVERIELRTWLNSYVIERDTKRQTCSNTPQEGACALPGSIDESGLEDWVVGAKVNLLSGSGTPLGQPKLTAIFSAIVPIGSEAYTNDAVIPEAKLVLDWPLTKAVALSTNLGYLFSTNNTERVISTYLSLGVSVPAIEGLGLFAGLYSLFPDATGEDHVVDGGVVFLVNQDTQLDLNLGSGLTSGSVDFFMGVGVARRF